MFEHDELGQQDETMKCANLLRAMEIEEEEEPDGESVVDLSGEATEDDDICNLPEEWIFEISEGQANLNSEAPQENTMVVDLDLLSMGEVKSSKYTNIGVLESDDGGSSITLMNQEQESQEQTQVEQKKGKGKKQTQWGPTIPLRRSSRHTEDGRPMMEKAQEAKRKWNLDDKTGKNTKISKPHLISVAMEIGLANLDGNPDEIDAMLELDSSRHAASQVNCKFSGCDSRHDIGRSKLFDANAGSSQVVSSKNDDASTSYDSASLDDKSIQNGNSEAAKLDQGGGWSVVGKKKRKKTKK